MTPETDAPSSADRLARLVVTSATDFAIITMDRAGLITSWSPGAFNVIGWTEAEAIGQHGRIIFTQEDKAAGSPEDEMARALAAGRAVDERWHVRRDGTRFWGSGLLMPLRNEAGNVSGLLKIVRDRSAEREAERRFATLTDALPGLVFVCDADGHNVQVNAQFAAYTGRPADDLLGDRWLEAVHAEDRERAAEAWKHAVETVSPYEVRFRLLSGGGAYRCFSCRGVPERDDSGKVIRWLGACMDVENEAQAQAAVHMLNRSLERAVDERTAELAAINTSLRAEIEDRQRIEEALRQSQKMEAIGQLTGGVAHDFNNLLTVIRGSADLLLKPGLSEQRRERYINAIRETAERAARLTSQLLAYARRQPLKPELFDVAERVEALNDVIRTVLGGRITFDTDVHCRPCLVEADSNQFETAILNMAVNARDAMAGEGRFAVRIAEANQVPATRGHGVVEGAFVAIAVIDSGVGMAPEQMSRIFEPFFTTKGVGKGTGLGLSQVFGFAKQSGGEVIVDSKPGEGATFTLYLPRAEHRSASELPSAPAAEPLITDEHGCVLLVEDNETVGEFAKTLLEELGYSTVWVSGAEAALQTLGDRPERFVLVFTDVVMPGMSGIELASNLRERLPDLPVVLTSGYSHVLAEQGAHGFELLQKPYSAEGLSRALRKVRRQKG